MVGGEDALAHSQIEKPLGQRRSRPLWALNLQFTKNRPFLGPILRTFWVVPYTFLGVTLDFITI